jgi:hypothetical protein
VSPKTEGGQGYTFSLIYLIPFHQEWNTAVDKCIASGVDSRSRSEIEEAAKIGISLGAMYRACEADGCNKVEGRNIEKVSTCARCKIVGGLKDLLNLAYSKIQTFYCGPTYQRSHWSTHKQVCGAAEQTERPLPSQVALSEFVCKYSPALRMYRKGDKAFDGFKFEEADTN